MSRAFRLGLFIVGTLLILVVGVFLIGERQFLFASTYRLSATFKNVAGLSPGAEVRVGGIHKGTVKRIQLPSRTDGQMQVVMQLETSTNRVVKADSTASIQTEGLLGSKYVEISFGSNGARQVNDGDSITGVPPLDISDLLKKTNDILDTTQETMVNVQDSSKHFKDITAKIDSGQGTMGALVNDKKVYEQLASATKEARLGAAAFQENMQALKHNFFLRGFFNNRGYPDSTKLTQHEVATLPAGEPLMTFRYDVATLFKDADTARLKNGKTLNNAGQFLERTPFGQVIVVSGGGMKGDAEQVHTLTQARAMVVRDYLVSQFRMDDTRVKTKALGKTPQTNGAGTVEIVIYPATPAARTAMAR